MALCLAFVTVVAAQDRSTPGPGAAAGAATFKGRCAGCHGQDGKGKTAIGTPDFTSSKVQGSLTDAQMVETITNGRKGTIMPAWKGKLSEEEIATAASYLRSLGGRN
jgi:cytochrome c oxidase cbb3-type subunit 3